VLLLLLLRVIMRVMKVIRLGDDDAEERLSLQPHVSCTRLSTRQWRHVANEYQ